MRCASVEVRALAHYGAVLRVVDELTIEHPAVFQRQMQLVAIFCLRTTSELHNARLPARAHLDPIWNRAKVPRATFYATSPVHRLHPLLECNWYANHVFAEQRSIMCHRMQDSAKTLCDHARTAVNGINQERFRLRPLFTPDLLDCIDFD